MEKVNESGFDVLWAGIVAMAVAVVMVGGNIFLGTSLGWLGKVVFHWRMETSWVFILIGGLLIPSVTSFFWDNHVRKNPNANRVWDWELGMAGLFASLAVCFMAAVISMNVIDQGGQSVLGISITLVIVSISCFAGSMIFLWDYLREGWPVKKWQRVFAALANLAVFAGGTTAILLHWWKVLEFLS